MDKATLLQKEQEVMQAFCGLNEIPVPQLQLEDCWPYTVCAYYRSSVVYKRLAKCTWIGKSGAA